MFKLLENHEIHYIIHKFQSAAADELTLIPDEVVISSIDHKGDWAFGFSGGNTGWFPLTHVKLIDKNYFSTLKFIDMISTDLENFKYSVSSAFESERDFMKEYKKNYEGMLSNSISKQLSCRVDLTPITFLCDKYIKVYDEFVNNISKENEKAPHKQQISKICRSLYENIFNIILNYCQIHPFLIYHILALRDDSEKEGDRKISEDLFDIIKFFSIVFLRLRNLIDNISGIAGCLDKKTNEYLQLKIIIAEFSLLNYGGEEVRKFYQFHASILPQIKSVVETKINNLQDMCTQILYNFVVHPQNIDIEEDPKPCYILITKEKFIYISGQIPDLGQYDIQNAYPIKNLNVSIDKNATAGNTLIFECSNPKETISFILMSSSDRDLMMDIFTKLSKNEDYRQFWQSVETCNLTIPTIPIKRKIHRHRIGPNVAKPQQRSDDFDYNTLQTIVLTCVVPVKSKSKSSNEHLNKSKSLDVDMSRFQQNTEAQISSLYQKVEILTKKLDAIEKALTRRGIID